MYTYDQILSLRSELLEKYEVITKKYKRNSIDVPFDIKKSCEFIDESINVDQNDAIAVDLKYRYLEFENYKLPFLEGIFMESDREYQKINKMNSIKKKITEYVASQYSILKVQDDNADTSHLKTYLESVDAIYDLDVSSDEKIRQLLVVKDDIGV